MGSSFDGRAIQNRIDRSCALLSDAYRRRTIYALQNDGPASVGELAEAAVADGIVDSRKRAFTALVHTHLPKLDEFGAVEYDRTDREVALAEGVERLEPFLETAARWETSPDQPAFPDDRLADTVGDLE